MRWIILAFGVVVGFATSAAAVPIVSVDANPDLAGVDASRTVMRHSTLFVDIVISGVEAGSPLNGFEFDLAFDPAVLSAVSVVDGGFLLDPVFQVQNVVGALSVEFAEITILPVGAVGSGVLATIQFEVNFGDSLLDLQNVILSAPFGVEIQVGGVVDGLVSAPIPEPSSALLFPLGFGVAGAVIRRLHRQRSGIADRSGRPG